MKPLLWSTLASLLVATTMHAQTRTIAERLGHPANSKLLILHADDLGVAHSENAASLDALDKGVDQLGEHHDPDAVGHRSRRVREEEPERRPRPAPHADQRVGDLSMGEHRAARPGAEPATTPTAPSRAARRPS